MVKRKWLVSQKTAAVVVHWERNKALGGACEKGGGHYSWTKKEGGRRHRWFLRQRRLPQKDDPTGKAGGRKFEIRHKRPSPRLAKNQKINLREKKNSRNKTDRNRQSGNGPRDLHGKKGP